MTALATWQDLCLDARDPQVMARFWAPVIGLGARSGDAPIALDGAADHQRVWVNPVDHPRRAKNRVHLDVYARSIPDLESLGASVVLPAEESGFGWTVMEDPEGGEFCAFLREDLPSYRLHGIGVDCVDPGAQAAWWGRILGVEPQAHEGHDWHTLEHATPDPVVTIDFAPVPEPRVAPNAVHWDVQGDVAALLDAGATHLWDTERWTVLADPEGNEFCVFPPTGG
jgi:GNAT superfamily N-acetyltransferase